MVAVELEVLAKKMDRFGWERDRGSAAHDRLVVDWMDALQDYPLDEVRAACRAAVLANPNKMPNEGHVKAEILKARSKRRSADGRAATREEHDAYLASVSRENINPERKAQAEAILAKFGKTA